MIDNIKNIGGLKTVFGHLLEWRQIYIQVILISAVTSLLLGVVLLYKNVRIQKNEHVRNQEEIHEVASILTPIVKNLDLVSAHAIGESLLARSYVQAVTIHGNSAFPIYRGEAQTDLTDQQVEQIQIPMVYQSDTEQRVSGNLLVHMDAQNSKDEYLDALQTAVGVFFLIAILGIVTAVLYANRYIIRPLQRYSEMVESHLRIGMPVNSETMSPGYFGRYQTQFGMLQQRIFRAQQEIQKNSIELERRGHLINNVLLRVQQTVRLYENNKYIDYNHIFKEFELPTSAPLSKATFEIYMIKSGMQEVCELETPNVESDSSSAIFYEFEFRSNYNRWFNVKLVDLDRDCVALIITNISAVKETENRLRHSQKMEIVGSLTSGIAHDFNNVLAIIYGKLELILHDRDDPASVKSHAITALRASQSASSVVTSLLSFSKRAPERILVVAVSDIMHEIVAIASSTLASNIELKYKQEDDAPLKVDVASLETAVINLIINARDAMRDGGEIVIVSRSVSDFEATNMQLTDRQAYIVIEVCDQGSGVNPENSQRITESFFTTKSQGTGLGLSMVVSTVKNAGGQLFFANNPAGGATFSLLLPRCEGENIDIPANEFEVKSGANHRADKRIVVIEDNVDLLEVMQKMLSLSGFDCVGCTSIQQAKAHAQSESLLPVVIVSDLNLGDGNALDLASAEFERWRNVPKIVMSGNMEYAGGTVNTEIFSDSLLKPVSGPELVRAINKLID